MHNVRLPPTYFKILFVSQTLYSYNQILASSKKHTHTHKKALSTRKKNFNIKKSNICNMTLALTSFFFHKHNQNTKKLL